MMSHYKVWLEISRKAVKKNIQTFRALLVPKTKLFAVVKSNAYGHGLAVFSGLADQCGVDGFCVDSVVEGLKLRKNGIRRPILVLGHTLPHLYKIAAENDITVTIANREAFQVLDRLKSTKPLFHLKIDTGMHRQGFYPNQISGAVKIMRNWKLGIKNCPLTGVYTHFAMVKDCADQTFTEKQSAEFKKAIVILENAGFKNLLRHAAATGGTLLGRHYHYDAVRVGIGLYGIWPSSELERQLSKKIKLAPVMRWRAMVSEVKLIPVGASIGYDATERAEQSMKIAVIPIGYWHGVPRALSSIGRVYIGRHAARIVGRVSMDMIVVDVTHIPCRVGTGVEIRPLEIARVLDMSPYEAVTRINPLIYKKIEIRK